MAIVFIDYLVSRIVQNNHFGMNWLAFLFKFDSVSHRVLASLFCYLDGDIGIVWLENSAIGLIIKSVKERRWRLHLFYVLGNLKFILENDLIFFKVKLLEFIGCNLYDVKNFLLWYSRFLFYLFMIYISYWCHHDGK